MEAQALSQSYPRGALLAGTINLAVVNGLLAHRFCRLRPGGVSESPSLPSRPKDILN